MITKKRGKTENDEESERKFRERLPNKYEGTKLKNIKINSTEIIKADTLKREKLMKQAAQMSLKAQSESAQNQNAKTVAKRQIVKRSRTNQRFQSAKSGSDSNSSPKKFLSRQTSQDKISITKSEDKLESQINSFLESQAKSETVVQIFDASKSERVQTTNNSDLLNSTISVEANSIKDNESNVKSPIQTVVSDKSSDSTTKQKAKTKILKTIDSSSISAKVGSSSTAVNKRNETHQHYSHKPNRSAKSTKFDVDDDDPDITGDRSKLKREPKAPNKINTSNLYRRLSRSGNLMMNAKQQSNHLGSNGTKHDQLRYLMLSKRNQLDDGDSDSDDDSSDLEIKRSAKKVPKVHGQELNNENENERKEAKSALSRSSSSGKLSYTRQNEMSAEERNERARLLFDYYYDLNNCGILKRLGSAKYALKDLKDQKPNQETRCVSASKSKSIADSAHDQSIDNSYFNEWLRSYHTRSRKLNERMRSAQSNQIRIQSAKVSKWCDSIDKKMTTSIVPLRSVLPFSPSPSQMNSEHSSYMNFNRSKKAPIIRQIQSAMQRHNSFDGSQLLKPRPKSVTFLTDSNQKLLSDSSERLVVKPSYLMSQIEMDDIMQEVEKRVRADSFQRVNSAAITDYTEDESSDQERDKRKKSSSILKRDGSSRLRNKSAASRASTSSTMRRQKYTIDNECLDPQNINEFHTSHR